MVIVYEEKTLVLNELHPFIKSTNRINIDSSRKGKEIKTRNYLFTIIFIRKQIFL